MPTVELDLQKLTVRRGPQSNLPSKKPTSQSPNWSLHVDTTNNSWLLNEPIIELPIDNLANSLNKETHQSVPLDLGKNPLNAESAQKSRGKEHCRFVEGEN